MSQGVAVAGIYVRDQQEALDFYVGKLGFLVGTDVKNGAFRWLTVAYPDQPVFQLGLFVPGPPMLDESTAKTLHAMVAKGAMPASGDARRGLPRRVPALEFSGSRIHARTDRSLWHH
jgi:catechol 2,3-dioxygenase-like lactoylglutathione lyase family enzyme